VAQGRRLPREQIRSVYDGCLTYVDDPKRGADFDDDGKLIVVRGELAYYSRPQRLQISLGLASCVQFALQ
jgi:hypothetical protein